MPVEHERRVVVQLVDDDVVAARQPERAGDDVLAFAGGEQEADLRRAGTDQPRERGTHLIGAREHVAERDRLPSLALGKCPAGVDDRLRRRRDVGRIEIELLDGGREVGAHAQRVGRAAD